MRRSVEETRKRQLTVTIITAALSCTGVFFLFTLIFSAAAAGVDLSAGGYSVMSGIALSAGCFAAAYTAAKSRRRKGLLTGLMCGAIVFLIIFILGLIFVRSFSAGGFLSKLIMVLSCSGIGGIIGVNSKKKFWLIAISNRTNLQNVNIAKKNRIRRGIIKGFSREIVNPILYTLNRFIGNISEAFPLGKETANKGILLLIQTSFK